VLSEEVDVALQRSASTSQSDAWVETTARTAACQGIVGTCTVSSGPGAGRQLTPRGSPGRSMQTAASRLIVSREYDFERSANISSAVGDMISSAFAQSGITIMNSTTTSLSATSTVTSLGDASDTSVAQRLDSPSLASALAMQLPSVTLDVSSPLVVTPPAVPPLPLPPPPGAPPEAPPAFPPPLAPDYSVLNLLTFLIGTFGGALGCAVLAILACCLRRRYAWGGKVYPQAKPLSDVAPDEHTDDPNEDVWTAWHQPRGVPDNQRASGGAGSALSPERGTDSDATQTPVGVDHDGFETIVADDTSQTSSQTAAASSAASRADTPQRCAWGE